MGSVLGQALLSFYVNVQNILSEFMPSVVSWINKSDNKSDLIEVFNRYCPNSEIQGSKWSKNIAQ